MEIAIPCQTLIRLKNIHYEFTHEDTPDYVRHIYVERKNKQLFVIATNRYIAAIEHFVSDGPDQKFYLTNDATLWEAVGREAAFGAKLHIVYNDMLAFASAKTTFGYAHADNVAMLGFPKQTKLDEWRNWFPDELPTKPKGAMSWHCEAVARLGKASPSGRIVFPSVINVQMPVMVTDHDEANWVGLFMSFDANKTEPATIPEWVK